MRRYAAPEININFFYTAQIFCTYRILQNSSFSFKQNVVCKLFTNKGSLKNVLVFTRKKRLKE